MTFILILLVTWWVSRLLQGILVRGLKRGGLAEAGTLATVIGGRGVLSAVSADGRVKQRLSVAAGDVREPAWGPFIP